MNSNNNATSKDAVCLEQIPFTNSSVPQYYSSCADSGEKNSNGGTPSTRDMGEGLLEEEEMSMRETSRWRNAALAVSWISVVGLFIIGVCSFVVSGSTNSSAAFGFGFDCLLDVGTSAVVLWRFMGSVGTVHSPEKERIALLFLGALFVIAAISIFARSIPDLISSTETSNGFWLILLAGISMTICILLAVSKFIIARKLDSKSILSDGYSSLAGAITTLSMLISSIVISEQPSVWYLDEVIGLIVGLLLCFYGIKLLVDVLQYADMKGALIDCLRPAK
ncbi:transmembrane protein 163a-like [Diadema antillarum]|uniref:transmembrane protein 163a-like n=1 Tax=Diadema antillarum TaxID=105358 RepID=UPI003A839069